MRTDEEILAELRTATAGLLVMSESDYPFETVRWDGNVSLTPDYLCSISGKPEGSPIEESEVENFLSVSGQFQHLASLLKDRLSDLRVYKIGTINIPVYIVGRSAEGNWLGLSTRVVQT